MRTAPRHPASSTREAILAVLGAAGRSLALTEVARAVSRHPNSVREQLDALVAAGQVGRSRRLPAGRGRPAFLYQRHPDAEPPGLAAYRSLAEVLAAELARSTTAAEASVEAGERWGAELAQAGRAEPQAGRAEPQAGTAGSWSGDDQPHAGIAGPHPGPPQPLEPTSTASHQGRNAGVDRLVAILDEAGFAPDMPLPTPDDHLLAPIVLRRCPFEAVARAQPGVVCGVHLGMIRGALRTMGAPVEVAALEPFPTPDRCLVHLSPAGRPAAADRGASGRTRPA